MYNWNAYTHTSSLMFCDSYCFEVFYSYDMSYYLSMHFAALQNKINCLAATENATALIISAVVNVRL